MKKWLRRALLALLAVVLFYALGATWSVLTPPPYVVTVEEVKPRGEKEVINRLVRKGTAAVLRDAKDDHFHKRDAHFIPHGCVRASFTVRGAIEAELQHGVFAKADERYRAWIRFSNSKIPDDRKPDGRGMAVKVMGADDDCDPEQEKCNQDFLMLNSPQFLARNVFEYEEFIDHQAQGHRNRYFFGANPFRWRLREFWIAFKLTYARVGSPLD